MMKSKFITATIITHATAGLRWDRTRGGRGSQSRTPTTANPTKRAEAERKKTRIRSQPSRLI
jgi:hypothetical protein